MLKNTKVFFQKLQLRKPESKFITASPPRLCVPKPSKSMHTIRLLRGLGDLWMVISAIGSMPNFKKSHLTFLTEMKT